MKTRALFAACIVIACEASGFEPEYIVDTLRVLAVQADLPFAAPGETVHFTTDWVDPLGNGRPIQWAWGTCVNPGSTQVPDCAAALASPLAFGAETFSTVVPSDALANVPAGELGVIFAACAGTLTLVANSQNGAPVTCTDASGALVSRDGFVWGGTRVVIVSGLRNQNPNIDKVFIDGTEWAPAYAPPIESCTATDSSDCPASAQHDFTFTATSDSAETYDLGMGAMTEQLVGWIYVTQGSLSAGYSSAATDDAGAPISPPSFDLPYAPTLSDRSHPLQVFFVLRDDRGGITFTERHTAWK